MEKTLRLRGIHFLWLGAYFFGRIAINWFAGIHYGVVAQLFIGTVLYDWRDSKCRDEQPVIIYVWLMCLAGMSSIIACTSLYFYSPYSAELTNSDRSTFLNLCILFVFLECALFWIGYRFRKPLSSK